MLKNALLLRLLKKVQMQGGVTTEARGVLPGPPQRRGGAPTPQMGLFQQPGKARTLAPASGCTPHTPRRAIGTHEGVEEVTCASGLS